MKVIVTNSRLSPLYFSMVLLHLLFFAASSFLKANDFPIIIDCANDVCDCKIDKAQKFSTDEIIQKLSAHQIEDTAKIACLYHQLGVTHHIDGDFQNAIEYYNKAIKLREEFDDGWLWKSNMNIARCYYYLSNYSVSIKYFEQAKDQPGNPKRPIDSLKIFRLLGDCYKEIGEFDKALQSVKKAINVNVEKEEKIQSLLDYAHILIETKDSTNIKKSIICLDSLEKKFHKNDDTYNLIRTKNNLGNANNYLNELNNAIKYYTEAYHLQEDTISKAIILGNIATIFTDKRDFANALGFLDESLRLKKSFFENEFHYQYFDSYENFGDYYMKYNKLDSALLNYQKAIINLSNNFRNEDIFQNPNPLDTNLYIYSTPDLIQVLHLKATSAYQFYHQNNNLKYLNLAYQTYQTLIDFHNKLQQDISTENSRLFQVKNILVYLEQALEVAYSLQKKNNFNAEGIFRLMEKNKATVLLQSINEADALKYANLPDSLLEQEKDFKIAISFYEQQLNEAKLNEDTITVINKLENTLFENKEKYSRLINNLEENHPNYYRLKYQQNQTKLANIQKQLNDQTALLSYFVGDSSIYTLLILKHNTQLFKIQKPADWGTAVNNFQESITLSNPKERFNKYNKKSFKKFVASAQTLYQYLLQEPLKELNHISHLKIIPDAELNYFPFDLLLTNTVDTLFVDYIKLPYLLKQKTISYAYSAALMTEQKLDTTKKDYAYGGYAPKYDGSNYSDLPITRQLVKALASFFKGKNYLNEEATKSNFLKDNLSYKILHLAMHGKLDDQYPLNSHLIFTKYAKDNNKDDYKLYAVDLYLHKINTDLAILNACETGTGKLRKGEGVMSLSRAFTYAGCPSLMMSLWSIDENPSAEILETFLKSIKKGTAKDVALQQAKLDYLNNTSANFSHPNYWSGLVLTGNTNAMQFENSSYWLYWILVVPLLIFGGYWTFKKFN